jgi:hypothetical protein
MGVDCDLSIPGNFRDEVREVSGVRYTFHGITLNKNQTLLLSVLKHKSTTGMENYD